jgi:putative spermidine/putrescine transport system permease protein
MKPVAGEWQLVLPLALFFVVFVFAPLGLLGIVSFYNDSGITTPGVAQYVKFLTDRFNMAVLG